MVNRHHKSFRADDRSFFSLIKKDIHGQVVAAGFDEVRAGKMDIIVAEITSNLIKYAKGGQLLAGPGFDGYGEYFEVISMDKGPGIPDLGRVLSDGYSSTGVLAMGSAVSDGSPISSICIRPAIGVPYWSRAFINLTCPGPGKKRSTARG